ncbi:MAG: hypothetical protein AAF211_00425, partial [Myxococcota bacterium]
GRTDDSEGEAWVMVADAEGRFVRSVPLEGFAPVEVTDVPVGGAITIAVAGDRVSIQTIFDVRDGDTLVDLRQPRGERDGTYRIGLSDPGVKHQSGNLEIGRCDTVSGGVTFPLVWKGDLFADDCLEPDGTLTVAALTRAPADGRPLSLQTRTGILPTGSPPDLVVDVLLDGAWETPGLVELTLSDPTNQGLASEVVAASLRNGRRELRDRSFTTLSAAPLTRAAAVDPTLHDRAMLGWEVDLADQKSASRIEWIEDLPALGGVVSLSRTLDDLPPALTEPTFDRTSVRVDLPSEDCDGTPFNMMVLELQTRGDEVDPTTRRWNAYGPASETFVFPELDPALAERLWPAGFTPSFRSLTVLALPGGFEAVRSSGNLTSSSAFPPAWIGIDEVGGTVCATAHSERPR